MALTKTHAAGTWLGFPIRVDLSWWGVLALVVAQMATEWLPGRLPAAGPGVRVGLATALALLLYLCLIAHELAHATVARNRGIVVDSILLFALGGMARMTDEPDSAEDEFWITVVGPVTSFTLGVLFALVGGLLPDAATGPMAYPRVGASFLSQVNLAIALFNLIPAFPLDGGRLLRAGLWSWTGHPVTATRWAGRGTKVFGYALYGLAAALVLFAGDLFGGLWAALVGWFLQQSAGRMTDYVELRHRLEGGSAAEAVDRCLPHVDRRSSLADAGRHVLWLRGVSLAPVLDGGRMIGVLSFDDLQRALDQELGFEAVTTAMTELDDLERLPHYTPLVEVLARLQRTGADYVVVTRGGQVLGLLTPESLLEWAAHRAGVIAA